LIKPIVIQFISSLVIFLVVTFSSAAAPEKPATPVIISEVRLDTFHDRVEALGTLRANESLELTATITDTVTSIHFEDGQRVKAGDVLIEMTSTEEHATLEEEKSTLAEAKKQLNRIQSLTQKGATTPTLLDERLRDYDTARARLQQVESRLRDRLILAPFSGVVGLRNISVGALVEPGDLITTLDDDSMMKLDFSVPAIHLDTLKTGLTIEATAPAFGKRIFTGKISSLNSRVDEATRSIVARAILANPETLLRPGMLMSVELLKNPRKALVIPEEALLPMGKTNHVLLVNQTTDSATTEKREVQIGQRRPGEVEILSGLSEGDQVVIHGAQGARPGEPIKIISVDKGDETLLQMLSRQHEDNQ